MRVSTRILFLLVLLLAVLVFVLTGPSPAAHRQQPFASAAGPDVSVQLPDRRLEVSAPAIMPAMTSGAVQASITVTVTNTGPHAFAVRPDHFSLSAEGDMFGQGGAPGATATLTGTIGPGVARAGQLTFMVPRAALPRLALVYHVPGHSLVASIPLGEATTAPAVSGATHASSAGSVPLAEAAGVSRSSNSATGNNTIEDTFIRPNQTGWGMTTNPDGVPNATWGMDGNGAKPYVTISTNTGVYGYPGSINAVGIASSGSTTYNGGDSLVKFAVSAVGHVTPYVVQNACSNKSCYYGARLHTSQNRLELAKRVGNWTNILTSVPFTASANTFYWMRLDVTTGVSDTLRAKIWVDGSPEPVSWLVLATDTSPLAANLVGTGGSWEQVGTGESIQYGCYAYASSGLASPCGTGPVPTPAATATSTATLTPTSTPALTPTSTATSTVTPTSTPTPRSTPLPPTPTATPMTTPAASNTIEDVFIRPDQTGWGTTTNPDGVPYAVWGMDGDGTHANVTISTNTGVYSYPGVTNVVGIASAASMTYNGGDSLVKFAVSAVGHVTPYVVENACDDKSCYYGARLHTSQNRLELAKRVGNWTNILTSVPFTASANTFYWMRLDVVTGTSDTVQAKIWVDGSPEPVSWLVLATDASPLAANLVGTGGSWEQVGTGESIQYGCYAYASSGLASPCGTGPVPTPAPTPTTTPIPTVTSGTVQEYPLDGGDGDPWGTGMDASGNVWFAEPGCDFAPTCSSSTPPGQLGELLAGSNTVRFYTLPNITGNQPIFVALDSTGNVWFTTPNNSMIGEFNPTTQSFVGQWAMTPGSGPWDLTFDQSGEIWYTEHLASAVGEFDPATHAYTDFPTPSLNSNPYGIAASGSLVWFTENNSSVARIAKLDTSANDQISEYLIRQQLPGGLTPHMIGVDANGHPWWTEGWVRAIGTLDPGVATPGQCGPVSSAGDCTGVTEFPLPASTSTCNGSHVSGLAVQGGSNSRIWLDDSLAGQVGAYTPATKQFALDNLSCVHPHDGLDLDPALHVWWDEEFHNALGELTQ